MSKEVAVALKWIGRLLVLAAALVLVGSLFAPSTVRGVIDPVVCPDGYQLDNERPRVTGSDRPLELVCTSPDAIVDARMEVAVLVGGLLVAGLVVFVLRARLQRDRFDAPRVPPHG